MQISRFYARSEHGYQVRPASCPGSLLLVVLATLFLHADAQAGLKFYYMRHAQRGVNVVKDWWMIPRFFRPSYAGNEDAFTPLGETQAKSVAGKISRCHFDFIAVSPKWRARQTILPFLKQAGRQAEIWPELAEFWTDPQRTDELIARDNFQPERDDLFSGEKIEISDEEKPFFVLRNDRDNQFNLRHDPDERIEDCVDLLRDAIARIKRLSYGLDASILLVGHGNSGRMLARLLVKNAGNFPDISNTGVWMAEEQSDGTFELKLYNDEPVVAH